MANAKIGISGSFIIDGGGMFPGYKRAYVNDDYIKSVSLAGGVPFILPLVEDEELVYEQVRNMDAIILSGGHDVNPLLWGEEPLKELGETLQIRDTYDMRLIRVARELKKPLLGICRGAQILNVANGGSLYQDLKYIEGGFVRHWQEHQPTELTHSCSSVEGSRLRELLGEDFLINSFHHLAIKEVAKGFSASAFAKDGVVEAIECEGEEFIMGVQWHPEMLAATQSNMLGLFKALINAAEGKNG